MGNNDARHNGSQGSRSPHGVFDKCAHYERHLNQVNLGLSYLPQMRGWNHGGATYMYTLTVWQSRPAALRPLRP